MIQFTVYGTPVGKGRPKFSTVNGHAVAYTPKKTANYETLVLLAYQQKYGGQSFDKDVKLKADITAFFSIPKSTSKKKREEIFRGNIKPTKKPDCDNIAKVVLDALNKVAYYDDSQIVRLTVQKLYSDEPCVIVHIWEDDGNDSQNDG